MIPETDVNDPDSADSLTARKLRRLVTSYEEKIYLSVPNYDDVHGKALLLAMAIKIGDQVSYGEDKVSHCIDALYSLFMDLSAPSVLVLCIVCRFCQVSLFNGFTAREADVLWASGVLVRRLGWCRSCVR